MPRLGVVASLTVVAAAGLSATGALSVEAGSVPWEVTGDLTIDSAPATIAYARALVVQEAGVEIRVGGVAIPREHLIGAWRVHRSRREAIQAASFEVALSEWGVSPLGDPWGTLGSPTGLAEIELWGIYRDDDTGLTYRFPLLLRGIVDNVHRESGPGGHVEVYQVLDVMARWSRIPISIVFPPGHGLTTGRMGEKMLGLAGETSFALEPGRQRHKEAQFVDADALAGFQELLDVEGRVLRSDRYGRAVNPALKPPTTGSVVAIDEEDILWATTVSLAIPSDVITEVTATGTEQIHTADEVCGLVASADQLASEFRTFVLFDAKFSQGTDCSLTDLSPTPVTRSGELFSVTITRLTTRCGTPYLEESETWQYFTPEAARWLWVSGGRGCLAGVYLDDAATDAADDASPSYQIRRAAWLKIASTSKRHFYDAPEWWGPVGEAEWFGAFLGGLVPTGRKLGTLTESLSYYNVGTATKARGGMPVSFETLDVRDVYQLGGGRTVVAAAETLQLTTREVELFQADGGYQTEARALTYGYAVVPGGSEYQFTDGSLSNLPDEQLALVAETKDSFTPITGSNSHVKTTLVANLGESPHSTSETVPGGPPPAEYLPGYAAYDANAFLSADDLLSAETAKAGDTKPIKVTLSATGLLATHLPRISKATYPYAEDEDELYAAALSVIRESLVFKAQLALVADFRIAECQLFDVTHRPSGIGVARRMILDSVEWSGAFGPPDRGGQPTLTTLDLDAYPVGE